MSTFMDLYIEYSNVHKALGKYVDENRCNNKQYMQDYDLPAIRSMRSEVGEARSVIKEKIVYEFNGFSEQDIKRAKLTENEFKVLSIRSKSPKIPFSRIDTTLGFDSNGSISHEIFNNGIKKVKSALDRELHFIDDLSGTEKIVYELLNEGYNKGEISRKLGKTLGTIKSAHQRIKKKCDLHCVKYPTGGSKIA